MPTPHTRSGGALHTNLHTTSRLRVVPGIPPYAHAPQLGWHRRCNPRPLADHCQDRCPRSVCELWLGYGGFKATPGSAHVFAWTIARDEPHPINAPFTIERFRDGLLIDEAAAAAVAH